MTYAFARYRILESYLRTGLIHDQVPLTPSARSAIEEVQERLLCAMTPDEFGDVVDEFGERVRVVWERARKMKEEICRS